MAKKKGKIKKHYDFALKHPQSFEIHHEEGQFQGTITNPVITGCVYKNGKHQEIVWKVDTAGNWYVIQPSDATYLQVTATPSQSGRPCPRVRSRRDLKVTVTLGDLKVTVTSGGPRGLGDLTATVTNGDGNQVVAYSNDVTYNE